jgi:hypothetical protein
MLGATGYVFSEEIFSFFNNKDPRPSTSLRRLLQEKTTSRLLFERTQTRLVSQVRPEKQGGFRV